MRFETDQIGGRGLIPPTIRLNDGSTRLQELHTAGDSLQVTKDRLDVWPGKIRRIVDVAIGADDHFELGDNAEKRVCRRKGKSVLNFQSRCRGLDFRLVGDQVTNLCIRRRR